MSKKNKEEKSSQKIDLSYIDQYAIPFENHHISKNYFHPHALKIISKLEDNGFQAFIVGGAVRDLLCNIEPKDFDISTNASPEEVAAIFTNSRLIGRRFRLVHIFLVERFLRLQLFAVIMKQK